MDEKLRNRLIGAVAVAAIFAIFWPLIFDSAEQIRVSRESQIPEAPTMAAWEPAEVATPDENKVGWEQLPGSTEEEQAEPSQDTQLAVGTSKPAAQARQVPQLKPAAGSSANGAAEKPAAVVAANDASPTEAAASQPRRSQSLRPAWVVQVATLSQSTAADKLLNQLKQKDYRAYVKPIKPTPGSNKTLYRVMVGPKFDKRKATTIKLAVDEMLKVDSIVARYRP